MTFSTFYDHIITINEQTGKSIEEIGKRLVDIGITGLDISNQAINNESLANLEILRECGMHINSLPAYCDFIHNKDTAVADEILELALKLKTDKILVIPGFLKDGDDRKSAMECAVAPTKYLCEIAKEKGILVGIEDYDNVGVTLLNSDEMLWFLDRVPDLCCFFDTGNFFYCDENTIDAYNKLKHRIKGHVHLKDRARSPVVTQSFSNTQNGGKMYPCAIGEGEIPIKEILLDLVANGYDDCLTIEIYNSETMLSDIEKSIEYVKSILNMEK